MKTAGHLMRLVILLTVASLVHAENLPVMHLNIVPLPVKVKPLPGTFTLNNRIVAVDEESRRIAGLLNGFYKFAVESDDGTVLRIDNEEVVNNDGNHASQVVTGYVPLRTEPGAHRIVQSWLSLSTSRLLHIQVIGCQNDATAAGARRVFEGLPIGAERNQWPSRPLLAATVFLLRAKDGCSWQLSGPAATVIMPPTWPQRAASPCALRPEIGCEGFCRTSLLCPKFLFDSACPLCVYRSVHVPGYDSHHRPPPLRMADSLQSRRDLLAWALRATTFAGTLPAFALPAAAPESSARPTRLTEELSLAGEWLFRLDPDGSGEAHNWQQSDFSAAGWAAVVVPHTWQVMPGTEEYRGVAWYRRAFEALEEWDSSAVRIEFEAVFHSATVWVNGQLAGRHLRKGYTSFILDITSLLRPSVQNVIVVKVDSSFDEAMLPRGRSSDWAHDGGIYRPARLLVTSPIFIDRLAVDATPHFTSGAEDNADYASVEVSAAIHNTTAKSWQGQLGYRVLENDTGRSVLEKHDISPVTLQPGERRNVTLSVGTVSEPRLWHFDHPHLYTLKVILSHRGQVFHELNTTFGIRSIEVRNGGIYLNGEKARLMGVERMAGSNPEFGMAEPAGWITHDHDDLKNLNCVLSRVHWQQDRRVLDYCDSHGILLQSEIPAWGYDTFGKDAHPLPEIMQNGLEQLREMIERDRNHPSIISWGLCNEVDGQNPPAYEFAQRLYAEAKKLDPRRLCSYASNSLEKTPGKDVSALMDFIECNEYYESWAVGTPEDLRRSLQEIHRTFPEKPIVISEYGYCACVPERPEGDARRIEVLLDHTRVCRELDFVAGLIFFCYNDYRTHVGYRGAGATKQNPHGVVDLYGNRKPSYDVLRRESSPVEWLQVTGQPSAFAITLRARKTVPAHRMAGYTLRGVLYGYGEIPLERHVVEVPTLAPGEQATIHMQFTEKEPLKIVFDVLRPTAFSAYTHLWRA